MELSQRLLEQFVVLAEERHFGRAADRLSISQPPLSQAIQRLERQVGVQLVDRSTRAVELTAAGEAFVADARRLLRGQILAVERARRVGAGLEGDIHLGYFSGLAYRYLPRLLGEIRRRHPDLRLNLHQDSTPALLERTSSGQIDVALVRGPLPKSSGVDIRHLFTERLGALVPADHPQARRSSLSLTDIADDAFALPLAPTLGHLTDMINAACREAGFQPIVGARADSLHGLVSLVAAGGCVTIVPEQARGRLQSGVEFVPLEDRSKHLELTVAAVGRADSGDPAVARVLSLALEHSGARSSQRTSSDRGS